MHEARTVSIIASPYSRDLEGREEALKTSAAAAANEATLDNSKGAEDDIFQYMCTSVEEQAFKWNMSEFVRPDEHYLFSDETYIPSSAYMY